MGGPLCISKFSSLTQFVSDSNSIHQVPQNEVPQNGRVGYTQALAIPPKRELGTLRNLLFYPVERIYYTLAYTLPLASTAGGSVLGIVKYLLEM